MACRIAKTRVRPVFNAFPFALSIVILITICVRASPCCGALCRYIFAPAFARKSCASSPDDRFNALSQATDGPSGIFDVQTEIGSHHALQIAGRSHTAPPSSIYEHVSSQPLLPGERVSDDGARPPQSRVQPSSHASAIGSWRGSLALARHCDHCRAKVDTNSHARRQGR